ncbi:MAG: hypothetical protein J7K36_04890, partial [Archaeoglobaceae archaeon]|nr:hypothetical protein [Archaeoglobaceae archaeon]
MYEIFLSTVSSLIVALISVVVSHHIARRMKFKSNFKGIITEIRYNLALLNEIKQVLNRDWEAIKNQQNITPYLLTELNTFAFNYFVLEGHFTKLLEEDKQVLGRIYRLFGSINRHINRYT